MQFSPPYFSCLYSDFDLASRF
ncbi:hypothetical protein CAEBREN_11216 [Caenorhabditis brenneri]|uniref:Uncharacterized protein n=1 Tax=Caenorhabditis brenneri TaxID=135651 RepID=G0MFJ3_CAEBE|nr:hypothetical protein CAEBREN_11216 [Caenorhabditis brenneri]